METSSISEGEQVSAANEANPVLSRKKVGRPSNAEKVATITANLGVNPSLTITAQAERALSLWPNKDEEDKRPTQGRNYEVLAPIAPHSPFVPKGAVGELTVS